MISRFPQTYSQLGLFQALRVFPDSLIGNRETPPAGGPTRVPAPRGPRGTGGPRSVTENGSKNMKRAFSLEQPAFRFCIICGAWLNREVTVVRMVSDPMVAPFEPYRKPIDPVCVYQSAHEVGEGVW